MVALDKKKIQSAKVIQELGVDKEIGVLMSIHLMFQPIPFQQFFNINLAN